MKQQINKGYILGLSNLSSGQINLALVKDQRELVVYLTVDKGELEDRVNEILSKNLPVNQQLSAIAYDEKFKSDTDFIDAPSLIVDTITANLQATAVYNAKEKVEMEIEEIYPQLVMLDLPDKTELFIAESATERKSIKQHQPNSISSLVETFEKLLEMKKLTDNIEFGDESAYEFTKQEAEYLSEFDLSNLYAELKHHQDAYKVSLPNNLNSDVKAQMEQYFKFDAAASVMDALMDNIIIHLFATALEVGIKNITVIGEIEKITRFRGKFTEQAKVLGYELRFPTYDSKDNPAVGIAAAAFLQL